MAAVLPVYRVYTGEPPFFVLDVTDPQVKGLAGRGGVAAGEAWSLPGVLGVAGRACRGALPGFAAPTAARSPYHFSAIRTEQPQVDGEKP